MKLHWLLMMITAGILIQPLFGEQPEPGKQVALKMKAPKSLSFWDTTLGYTKIFETLQTVVPPDESEKVDLQYLLFLPENYQVETEAIFPLMLFLHGAGERGTDIEKVKTHGPPMLLAKDESIRKKCPFLVVSPQCLDNHYWSPGQILFLLDEIEKTYKVDKSRIYATGISMGGFGTWMLGDCAGEHFAAIAPVCGGISPEKAECFLELPIWAFHGLDDTVVPPRCSTDIVDAIKEKGGQKVKITLYPEVGHDSWVKAYQTEELYRWMLGKGKRKRE